MISNKGEPNKTKRRVCVWWPFGGVGWGGGGTFLSNEAGGPWWGVWLETWD